MSKEAMSVSGALKFELPRENNIVFYNGGVPMPENEVMRIDRQGVRVNPKLPTDEATDAVIRALDGYIKNLVARLSTPPATQPAQEPVAHCEAGPDFCQQCQLEDSSLKEKNT